MKLFSLFIILLAIKISSFAQLNSFGFFGGVNYSTLKFEHDLKIDEKTKYISGFIVGFSYTHALNKMFAIRGEIVADKKGGDYCTNFVFVDGDSFGPTNFGSSIFQSAFTYSAKDGFTYVGVPILFQIGIGQKFKYLFQFGHSLSYLLHRHKSYGNDELKIWNHSALAGMGFSIPVNNKMSIQTNARFAQGLNDFSMENRIDLRHINYLGTIGLQFSINNK